MTPFDSWRAECQEPIYKASVRELIWVFQLFALRAKGSNSPASLATLDRDDGGVIYHLATSGGNTGKLQAYQNDSTEYGFCY